VNLGLHQNDVYRRHQRPADDLTGVRRDLMADPAGG